MKEEEKLDRSTADEFLLKNQRKYVPGNGFRRYKNALENLIPIRKDKTRESKTMPVDDAGLFSMISFSWISKFMYEAYRKELKMEQVPSVSPYDTCDYNADRLQILWDEELSAKGSIEASFSKVAWKFCRTRVLTSSLLHLVNILCGFLSYSLFMRKLLEYVETGGGEFLEGAKWALLVTLMEAIRLILWGWFTSMNARTALRLRSACLTLLYKRIIGVNNLQKKSIGQIINLFSNDAQTIFDTICMGPLIIEAPVTTILMLFYILWLFSPIALLGMLTFALYYPTQYAITRLIGHYQSQTLKLADTRVRLMNEILDSVKLIKMYAWENRFSQDIMGVRKMERWVLFKTSYFQGLNVSISPTMPVISAIVTFLAYVSAGNDLTAAKAFPYASFLDGRFRYSLMSFRVASERIVAAGISFNRIKKVLLMEEEECYVSKTSLDTKVLTITNGTFAYPKFGDAKEASSNTEDKEQKDEGSADKRDESEEEKLTDRKIDDRQVDVLFEISFEAAKGKLVGICGPVGSGKSSLLLAALGQLRIIEGQVTRDGECAYVSQQAWITNATLRENILFGAKFDKKWYNEVVWACSLSQDIAAMPGGDETEIGERGINLSGGQKQRVALARALYADRDIYLLDDPLSAVDSRVGSHIFDNLILGALKEKTVLFVTHQIQYLNRCDDVYMMRDGRIVEHGTHDQLMKLDNEYASMVAAISIDNETAEEPIRDQKIDPLPPGGPEAGIPLEKTDQIRSSMPADSESTQKPSTPAGKSLTVAESVQRGTISPRTYKSYVISGGGYLVALSVILMYGITVASTAFGSWWLSIWINAGGGNATIVINNVTVISNNVKDNPDLWYYQTIYASTIAIIILTSVIRGLLFSHATIGASTRLHNNLFKKIIDAPMRFFDTTPVGRIQHLFSRDMDEIDNRLPSTLTSFINSILKTILTVVVICYVFPWFVLPVCLFAGVYYYVSKIFRVAIRDLKRMDNVARAPVISHVTAMIQGLSTIHAFGKENDFVEKFRKSFDENSKFQFMFNIGMSWLTLRIDAMSVASISITAFLIIIFRDQVPPAFAGLALACSTQISGALPFTMKITSETETRFTSVERINDYIEIVESESKVDKRVVEPPNDWPAKAEIKFDNVSLAYREGTPLVLKNLSFTVGAGEKIGIVGRTGAGKSSLTVALFRLVELAEGKIEIDKVDISEISLSRLRTKLSIIPQDPVLFSGTIRSNLDPFGLYADSQIWDALEKTELKNRVRSISGQLDASVGFGGDNMSVGERQLLCLSRALLRNSKILVLDEATAAVDPETEKVVQETVQKEFSDCTILVIAHRLQTVLSLDRVLVMEAGEILEFDTPSNLLSDENSEFSKMMAAAEESAGQ